VCVCVCVCVCVESEREREREREIWDRDLLLNGVAPGVDLNAVWEVGRAAIGHPTSEHRDNRLRLKHGGERAGVCEAVWSPEGGEVGDGPYISSVCEGREGRGDAP
jgi:hypothetical protein